MAIIKKRISEYPICQSLIGLWTIGVDAANKSVKVSLEFIQEAYENVVRATEDAVTVVDTANTAANKANTATENANTATENAKQATLYANTAAENANTATDNTNKATEGVEVMIERLEALEELLVASAKFKPTSMEIEYPTRVTLGNLVRHQIKATVYPANDNDCVMYLGTNTAISLTPDGSFTATSLGIERVHAIPTESTNLYQTATITVTAPTMRLIPSGCRFSSNGVRLT